MTMISRKSVYTISLFLALAGLGGCANLNQYVQTEPPVLTAVQQDKVGGAVEGKLIQMLGGAYYDSSLAADLNRMAKTLVGSNHPFRISVADRSAETFFPLPGRRAIMTRGLLSGIQSREELDSLLTYAVRLSEKIYHEPMTRSMVEATELVLSKADTTYDPASATIRLARQFEQRGCDHECLAVALPVQKMNTAATSGDLPESLKRLHELQPGYELLSKAREFELSGDQGKAIATYLQAAAAVPDEPQILGSLGLAYLRAGQLQPARLHLQNAVKLQPDYYRTLMGLGYLYQQQGALQKANGFLSDSVRLLATAENLFLLAEVREKNGDPKGALSLYRLVIEVDPDSKLGRTSASRLAEAAGAQ